jgi:hypothetical protein
MDKDKLMLWRYEDDFGRMGSLDGCFLASIYDMEQVEGKTAYLYDVLGKHSEIHLQFDMENCNILISDHDLCQRIYDQSGTRTLSGWSPWGVEFEEDFE